MNPIVTFLSGMGRDTAGRTLSDVLDMDDFALEAMHDYIQWLFPLPARSSAVPSAPVLSNADIATIRNTPAALANLTLAADRSNK